MSKHISAKRVAISRELDLWKKLKKPFKKVKGRKTSLDELVSIVKENSLENETNVVCKKSERATIKYDVDKLKEKLDDELFIEVTKRSYIIKDIDAMIKLMKDAGVRARDFKALIEAKITPDTQAIKRLYDAGELNMKMLKGTYQATISKSIKITEETGDKD